MKNWIIPSILILVLIGLMATTFSGCGQSNTSSSTPLVYPGSCIGTGCSSSTTFTGGDTETLNIASTYALSVYAGMQITNPSDIQVNINLSEVTTSPPVFLGQMVIQYNDAVTGAHTGTFVNGTSTAGWNGIANNVSTLVGSTYRIFFEDPVGALILTINNPTGTDTITTSSGQIWFYNFNTTAPNPLYQGTYDSEGNYYPPGDAFCWEIITGGDPYNCRNFNVPPSTQYGTVPAFSLLGTIPTINLSAALGIL